MCTRNISGMERECLKITVTVGGGVKRSVQYNVNLSGMLEDNIWKPVNLYQGW